MESMGDSAKALEKCRYFSWPGSWRTHGFNQALSATASQLEYRCKNERAPAGASRHCDESLYQSASDLRITAQAVEEVNGVAGLIPTGALEVHLGIIEKVAAQMEDLANGGKITAQDAQSHLTSLLSVFTGVLCPLHTHIKASVTPSLTSEALAKVEPEEQEEIDTPVSSIDMLLNELESEVVLRERCKRADPHGFNLADMKVNQLRADIKALSERDEATLGRSYVPRG